jgi:hypothetical protein
MLKMDREIDLSYAIVRATLIAGDLLASFLKGNALLDMQISICRSPSMFWILVGMLT